jgi:pilus assembly protein CpaB
MLVVLALAAVIGVVVSTLVYRTIAQVAAPGPQEGVEQIVVAAANMTLGETVTTQHVKLVAYPKASVPDGALKSLAEAEGRVVRGSIVTGEPLLEAKLAPQMAGRGGVMPMLVPEGQRGVTIKVDEAVRETGFILPNSHVDVLVSMPKPGSAERFAKLILQDVTVLAAGQSVEMRDNKPVTVTTVTLALTPEQAERLALGQTEGRLFLATRNLRDKNLVQTPGVNAAKLLGTDAPAAPKPAVANGGAAKPRTRVAKASDPLPAPKVSTHSVSVFRGAKESEHVFLRVGDERWVEKRDEKSRR